MHKRDGMGHVIFHPHRTSKGAKAELISAVHFNGTKPTSSLRSPTAALSFTPKMTQYYTSIRDSSIRDGMVKESTSVAPHPVTPGIAVPLQAKSSATPLVKPSRASTTRRSQTPSDDDDPSSHAYSDAGESENEDPMESSADVPVSPAAPTP